MARGGISGISAVCAYVASRTGSSLSPQQHARLAHLLELRRGGRTEQELLQHLQGPSGAADLADLMSAISVHKTDLFRDEVQLNAFTEHVLRPLARASSRPLCLWSAGCATGEEVATLLVLLEEVGAHSRSTVLGTDISETALRQARELSFHPSLLRQVPEELRAKYFSSGPSAFELRAELKARATFCRHNLMDRPFPEAPNGQGFDVIFCRNVLIYFTEEATERAVEGLAHQLKPGGTLVLSAAEPLLRPHSLLTTLRSGGAFFYVRRDPRAAPPPPRVFTPSLLAPRPLPVVLAPPPEPAFPTPTPPLPPIEQVSVESEDPREEASRIFELVLEWAAAGDNDQQTEQGLRKCVYLDPHFAQARYLLGMVLEQRGAKADAAAEYRRALAALSEGRARQTPFFLNEDRLKQACAKSLSRLGYR